MSLLSRSRQMVTRRMVVLGSLMALPFPVLLARLYYLQNISGAKYKKLAEKNRLTVRPLQPRRGSLLDKHGRILAEDVPAYRLVMIREQMDKPLAILKRLQSLISISKETIMKKYQEAKQRSSFTPVTLVTSLPFDEMARVQTNLPYLPGIDISSIALRNYTHGELLGHITGYVGLADEKMLRHAWSPDFPVGKRGLEQTYDDRLAGVPGILQSEVNAQRRQVAEIARQPARPGEDMRLSLDLDLQQAAWDKLGDLSGAAVVIDIKTGGLRALVSKPGFDPNLFTEGIDKASWQKLLNNEEKPLLNRTLQGMYSPGSTFKMIVALAALEEGVGRPDEKITCKGHIQFGDRKFHCWKKHGTLDLRGSIRESCDIYYYELAQRIGIDKIAEYARQFGLGDVSNLGLPEKSGLVPDKKWKKKTKGEAWADGETLISGIGQGFLLTTPLQLALMTARLATGKYVTPVLLNEHEGIRTFEKLPFEPKNLKIVQEGMYEVMNVPGGTAYYKRPRTFVAAGKSGTVQVISRRIEDDVDMSDVPLKKRPHGIFVAYAPYDDPVYAVAAIVEHGGSGSGAAAPVAMELLKRAMLKRS